MRPLWGRGEPMSAPSAGAGRDGPGNGLLTIGVKERGRFSCCISRFVLFLSLPCKIAHDRGHWVGREEFMTASRLLTAAGSDRKPTVIDENHLGRMTLGDRRLEREVLELFLRQTHHHARSHRRRGAAAGGRSRAYAQRLGARHWRMAGGAGRRTFGAGRRRGWRWRQRARRRAIWRRRSRNSKPQALKPAPRSATRLTALLAELGRDR